MDTQNQFCIFLSCVAIGFCGGVLYDCLSLVGAPFCRKGRGKWLRALLDIAFWLAFAVVTIVCAYRWRFPDFRVYTWIGYALGGIIYSKSLRRIVAFLKKVCYNKLVERKKERERVRKPEKG